MASIKDVAKEAGVSISTVSNVINGSKYVSEDLCDKVQKAIKDLNYEVDMVARSLKNNKSMMIGVVLTSMDRIFIPQVLNGMQHVAEERGFSLLIYTTNDNFEKEKKYLKMLVNSKVDGIILDSVAPMDHTKYYKLLSSILKGKKKIPVVSIERDLSQYGICSVFVDNMLGVYYSATHLIKSGCNQIVHISGPEKVEMVYHRTRGYKKALEENGIEVSEQLCVKGDFSPLSGYREIKRLFREGISFDGICADNDQMAIGAIKAIRENKLKVPQDIKIVGFDNTFVSSIVRPSLTTVNVPKYKMGAGVTELLCDLISEKEISRLAYEIPTDLVVRESTIGSNSANWDLEGW